MESKDLLCSKFGSVFNENDICFSTLSSATTIIPKTKITFLKSGNTIVNITPPINNYHELIFIPLGGTISFITGGNISTNTDFSENIPAFAFYNPWNKTYYFIVSASSIIVPP